jgi:DNA polymerase-3 subunit beta
VVLVSALSRALADRVTLIGLTIGRKGLLGYLKALGGSNIVKIIPDGSASGSQANGSKGLKVICGSNTGHLAEGDWTGEKTPMTFCEVRVSPRNAVKPNIGTSELAEALNRVLPFTARDDNRPVLQCVYFVAKDGKLSLISADGFRLAVARLDYDDGEGQALINRDDLKGVANALRRARRARVSFEASGDNPVSGTGQALDGSSLIIDTELIRYRWAAVQGTFPDYEKLTPTEFNLSAHFDTIEAVKAISSLKALSDSKTYPIDLNIGNGRILLANPDDRGQAELPADTEGEGKVRIEGSYLVDVLRACGGMVDFQVTSPISPTMFSQDGYYVVVMPMMTEEAKKQAATASKVEAETVKPAETTGKGKSKAKNKAKAEKRPQPKSKPEPKTEPKPEPEREAVTA